MAKILKLAYLSGFEFADETDTPRLPTESQGLSGIRSNDTASPDRPGNYGRNYCPAHSTAPQFEVASIKASAPGGRGGGIRPAPGGRRYVAANVPLKLMIQVAWRVKADQVAGGPGSMDTHGFDMNAEAERPSTVEELHRAPDLCSYDR